MAGELTEDILRKALQDACAEARDIIAGQHAADWRRDWIRRMAMHIAAACLGPGDGNLTPRGRQKLAREATTLAAALWLELEQLFLAEAETKAKAKKNG